MDGFRLLSNIYRHKQPSFVFELTKKRGLERETLVHVTKLIPRKGFRLNVEIFHFIIIISKLQSHSGRHQHFCEVMRASYAISAMLHEFYKRFSSYAIIQFHSTWRNPIFFKLLIMVAQTVFPCLVN